MKMDVPELRRWESSFFGFGDGFFPVDRTDETITAETQCVAVFLANIVRIHRIVRPEQLEDVCFADNPTQVLVPFHPRTQGLDVLEIVVTECDCVALKFLDDGLILVGIRSKYSAVPWGNLAHVLRIFYGIGLFYTETKGHLSDYNAHE